MATRKTEGNSLGSPIVSQEAIARGLRSSARVVLRTQASAVSKPASNWGRAKTGRGRVGHTLEESGGREETETIADVGWGEGGIQGSG